MLYSAADNDSFCFWCFLAASKRDSGSNNTLDRFVSRVCGLLSGLFQRRKLDGVAKAVYLLESAVDDGDFLPFCIMLGYFCHNINFQAA